MPGNPQRPTYGIFSTGKLTVDETQQLAKEGWYESLRQEDIGKWVDEMPTRLKSFIDAQGKMIGY